MKNTILKLSFTVAFLLFISCQKMVEGINENPNDILIQDVEAKLFLTGAQLANVQIQCGHLNRVGGLYSGQLIGFSSLYSNIYGYNLSTVESNGTWNALYIGVITNMNHIIANANDPLLEGIAKIVKAQAAGTSASLFGDIPYSETGNPEISDPVFDPQKNVYTAVLNLLDDGITTLNSAKSRALPQDIHFHGDKSLWIAAAYTLKARFYLHLKDYANALTAAQNGIASPEGDLRYFPRGEGNIAEGDKNLFWTILEGSRAGDIGNASDGNESYLLQLLNDNSAVTRNHFKTIETARYAYYKINAAAGSLNRGIIGQFEPQNMVTNFENLLIKAECAARLGTLEDGLPHLNAVRTWLESGNNLGVDNVVVLDSDNNIGADFTSFERLYLQFDAGDFAEGGIENSDNIDPKRAFLREVIEERYVSGFGMHMPYNDARRLRKHDQDIAVPYVLVLGPNPPYPERMPYAANELNSNSNAPKEDPGIFIKTAVNQ